MDTIAKEKTIMVHGVTYIRSGSCTQCGSCSCEERACPHFLKEDTKAVCLIHATLGEVCEDCTNATEGYWANEKRVITHKVCLDFPTHPFNRVIKENQCGFVFTPATKTDLKKHKALIRAWS